MAFEAHPGPLFNSGIMTNSRLSWTAPWIVLFAVLAPVSSVVSAPLVTTDLGEYEVGERVLVNFTEALGNGTDWVGIYPASQKSNVGSTYWFYTHGDRSPAGNGPISGTLTFLPMSLPPGDYEARYFFNDSYDLVDNAPFSVVSRTASPAPAVVGELTVMSFNIWVNALNGFGGVSAVVDAVRETQADLIGFQECSAATLNQILTGLRQDPHYASAVGSGSTSIISRYPIVETYTAGLFGYGVKVDVGGEGFIRFFNSHLSAYPYGPYSARDGASNPSILDDEWSTRASEMQAILNQLIDAPQNEPSLTTFLVGDHNCPSLLDWTPDNRDQNFDRVVSWPVSEMLLADGFVDAFREVHPDPVSVRGLTWSPGYPKASLALDDVHDRIDMIYYRTASDTTLTAIQSYTLDRDPWPADHRAVVASVSSPGFSIAVDALVQGQTSEIRAEGATPGTRVFFAGTQRGIGAGPCSSSIGGLCLDLANPVILIGSATVASDGTASLQVRVPGPAPLVTIHVQAVNRVGVGGEASLKSNLISTTIGSQ